jgi:hypothetical protein
MQGEETFKDENISPCNVFSLLYMGNVCPEKSLNKSNHLNFADGETEFWNT